MHDCDQRNGSEVPDQETLLPGPGVAGWGLYAYEYRVHWKEGMEVFESQEEALKEIDRLRALKMNSGHCPRCHFKALSHTDRDITHLDFLGKKKSGTITLTSKPWLPDKKYQWAGHELSQIDKSFLTPFGITTPYSFIQT